MKNLIYLIIIFVFVLVSCKQDRNVPDVIRKGNVTYDFSFAELAIKYLETGDSIYLKKIATLEATDHIMDHAKHFDYDVPKDSKIALVSYLLSHRDEMKKNLNKYKRNLQYAENNIAQVDLAQKVCLQYLPDGFKYSSKLFYVFGYDLGVVYGPNASLNLAHPHFLKDMREIKYYSIHELHHAGLVMLKKNYMPSVNVSTYKEMAILIEYFTQLEGMGTYAPLEIRKKENAMNSDKDYIALQDSALMKADEKEYFEIYFHFKNNPEKMLTEDDWEKLSILSDKKRLWYRVGAEMAEKIDKDLGRQKLTGLIQEPSENFINTYLRLKDKNNGK
ncbi:MAG: hypothetical protein GXO83_04655 [Chlorobi bacterium]|nr:hypothetical protein [Chlorobiota bacterium]